MECCATCRHWQITDEWPDYMVTPPNGWRFCRRAEADREVGDSTPQAGSLAVAAAIDTTGSGLLTASDFGCVQWAAKET